MEVMLVYARESSQLASYVPSQLSGCEHVRLVNHRDACGKAHP